MNESKQREADVQFGRLMHFRGLATAGPLAVCFEVQNRFWWSVVGRRIHIRRVGTVNYHKKSRRVPMRNQ